MLGPISSPVARTSLQAAAAEGLVRIIEVIPSPDLDISDPDRALIFVAVIAVFTSLQHGLERAFGIKLLAGNKTWEGPLTVDGDA